MDCTVGPEAPEIDGRGPVSRGTTVLTSRHESSTPWSLGGDRPVQ